MLARLRRPRATSAAQPRRALSIGLGRSARALEGREVSTVRTTRLPRYRRAGRRHGLPAVLTPVAVQKHTHCGATREAGRSRPAGRTGVERCGRATRIECGSCVGRGACPRVCRSVEASRLADIPPEQRRSKRISGEESPAPTSAKPRDSGRNCRSCPLCRRSCTLAGRGTRRCSYTEVSSSTQSRVRVTAFFHTRRRRSRSASSIAGSQRRSSPHSAVSSSRDDQKPTASPAA